MGRHSKLVIPNKTVILSEAKDLLFAAKCKFAAPLSMTDFREGVTLADIL